MRLAGFGYRVAASSHNDFLTLWFSDTGRRSVPDCIPIYALRVRRSVGTIRFSLCLRVSVVYFFFRHQLITGKVVRG